MYSTETVTAFLRRSRLRLDEELDAAVNFWSPSEMIEYMNEGIREVWASVRETHQNWFVRLFTSVDGVVNIGGRKYDTAQLRLIAGKNKIMLPPDFYELLLFETKINPNQEFEGPTIPAVVLEYANMTQQTFRQGVLDSTATGVRRYRYDVVYGAEGPYLFLSPTLSIENANDTIMSYISMPAELGSADTFEGTGLTKVMIDAVLAYVLMCAARKEQLSDIMAKFEAQWKAKLELSWRVASPNQTRDEKTVNGFLEEELL